MFTLKIMNSIRFTTQQPQIQHLGCLWGTPNDFDTYIELERTIQWPQMLQWEARVGRHTLQVLQYFSQARVEPTCRIHRPLASLWYRSRAGTLREPSSKTFTIGSACKAPSQSNTMRS